VRPREKVRTSISLHPSLIQGSSLSDAILWRNSCLRVLDEEAAPYFDSPSVFLWATWEITKSERKYRDGIKREGSDQRAALAKKEKAKKHL